MTTEGPALVRGSHDRALETPFPLVNRHQEEGPMPEGVAEVTTQWLQAFADAWNRHDIDALMAWMAEDCVFEPSATSPE